MSIKKENIMKVIDKNIIERIVESSLIEVIESLEDRIAKFTIIITRDNPSIVLDDYMEKDIDTIEGSRLRYNVCQIRHCDNRIEDIKWMIRKRAAFPKLTNKQVFNLILLKEKLQKK